MQSVCILLLLVGITLADPTVFFMEKFETDDFTDRWTQSKAKSDYGKFSISAGAFYGDAELDKGLKTTQDAKFYATSASFDKFSNEGKTLVIQFTVKHEQKIDCGGGYVKVFPSSVESTKMDGDSPYNVMFGPDICGPGTKKVHVIFNYKGKNLLIKKEIRCKDDEFTHLYTLILRSDNTYEVKIDNKRVEGGKLEDDWDFLAPKTIPDPDAKKPEDWDDKPKIDDPEATKPDDWDTPEYIPDPDATKPDDWDDDMDGEWEPPMIPNPEYNGPWKPPQIDNPNYQGEWVHPQIDNPDYEPDDMLYKYEDFGLIGFDLWQVKSGTIFDNILITDDEDYAAEFGKDTWGETKDPEKAMKDKQDEEERKKAEEAAKEMENADDDDEDEDEEDADDFVVDGADLEEEEEEEEDETEPAEKDEL